VAILINGITLCDASEEASCHIKAEKYYSHNAAEPGFSPKESVELIGGYFKKINIYLK
jgi:hypothetical protein